MFQFSLLSITSFPFAVFCLLCNLFSVLRSSLLILYFLIRQRPNNTRVLVFVIFELFGLDTLLDASMGALALRVRILVCMRVLDGHATCDISYWLEAFTAGI